MVTLVAGPLLLLAAHGLSHRIGVAIYAGCLSGLFGVSALYHRGSWGPVARRVLLLDHPVVPHRGGDRCAPDTDGGTGMLVGGPFVGLGAAGALTLPALWTHVGVGAATLVVAGGLLHLTGAVAYHHRRPDPSPAVFGYHEVFHAFVCDAATCHYVAIARLAQ